MSASSSSRWDFEVRLLAWLVMCVSLFSFLFYFRRGDVLLYGDAVAHINIARRVFDSKTPGLLQLGTVWLPLPHLLMIPFLFSDKMWQSGVGGSMPSMVAYVFGVIGMFRLVRGVLSGGEATDGAARIAAWTAAAVFGTNPNLIYMQTTAMGEALYLALFIWAVVYFSEFAQGDGPALTKCGLCLMAACLTRYDGWLLAAGMVIGVVAVSYVRRQGGDHRHPSGPGSGSPPDSRGQLSPQTPSLVRFAVIAAAAPALWLAYNAAVYRNPLEFENGPYSAKAIEKRTETAGSPGHPGTGKLLVAGAYLLKAGEITLAENPWLQRLWVLVAIVAVVVSFVSFAKNATDRTRKFPWPLLLLWAPLPFYALSIAYGGVAIFVPAWCPFTYYNVRYGLQLLPVFAASAGVVVYWVARSDLRLGKLQNLAVAGVIASVVAGYASVWRAGPVCYQEAAINMRSRIAMERQLANWLKELPPNSTLLMYLGDHPGAVQQAGIPLKRVINEGNHRVWKQPMDPEGLWERALANPSELADFVVAFEGDAVWNAVQGRHLPELVEIEVTGQRRAILYRAR